MTADGKVAVDVVDTGSGIAPEVAPRIFEPFFSTKAGAGTGLGLAISQHIVTSLGGTISATPNAPRGTRLRVVLPCADEAEAIESVRQEAARTETEAKNAHARILVVDDEPQITLMIARLLRPRAVDVAHGGKEALTRLSDGPRYDVIVCDLHMNDLTGMDVYEHLQRAGGGLERRVIFMTGGVMSERASDFVARCDCPLLDKPFDGPALESAIESVLERGSRP
ncbi:MAG TPA: ATP-binding protein [Polyangiaceae bacterium]|nr:ATP-binding protein [Polyangiaceae bacterium]